MKHSEQYERTATDQWYVATTLPHMEAGAAGRLQDQGFEVFLPLHRKTIRHARRLSDVVRPVFPGYLFIRMDTGRCRWRAVNGTQGIGHLIASGASPLPVRSGVVEALKEATDSEGLLHLANGLEPGDTVRLKDGPFANTIGTLLSLRPNDRCQVLISWLGSRIPVGMSASGLTRAC